jgi:hypothetical protein
MFKTDEEMYTINCKMCHFHSKTTGGKSQQQPLQTHGQIVVDTRGSYDAGYLVSVGNDLVVLAIKCVQVIHAANETRATWMTNLLTNIRVLPIHTTTTTWFSWILYQRNLVEWLGWRQLDSHLRCKSWEDDILADGLENNHVWSNNLWSTCPSTGEKEKFEGTCSTFSGGFSSGTLKWRAWRFSVFAIRSSEMRNDAIREAKNEIFQRPLYSVSLGPLGTTLVNSKSKLEIF